MRFHSKLRRSSAGLAGVLAALAVAAPVAPARPVEQFLGTASQNPCGVSSNAHNASACKQQAQESRGSGGPTVDLPSASVARDLTTEAGFSWGAAAIGAGTAVALLALGSMAALALTGRGRMRTAR
jgi:hypothetical protein